MRASRRGGPKNRSEPTNPCSLAARWTTAASAPISCSRSSTSRRTARRCPTWPRSAHRAAAPWQPGRHVRRGPEGVVRRTLRQNGVATGMAAALTSPNVAIDPAATERSSGSGPGPRVSGRLYTEDRVVVDAPGLEVSGPPTSRTVADARRSFRSLVTVALVILLSVAACGGAPREEFVTAFDASGTMIEIRSVGPCCGAAFGSHDIRVYETAANGQQQRLASTTLANDGAEPGPGNVAIAAVDENRWRVTFRGSEQGDEDWILIRDGLGGFSMSRAR